MTVKKRLRKSYLRMFLIPMLSATLLLVLFIVLAVVTAIAIPLSLSQQISDASAARQQVQQAELSKDQAEKVFESRITPLDATNYAIIGGLGVIWVVLVLVYWFNVVAWLYKRAVNEGMNKSLWPILGLFLNFIAVFAFLIARDRPSRVLAKA